MAQKTYSGIFEGQTFRSLHPNLYRVEYESFIGNRKHGYSTLVPGASLGDIHARYSRRSDIIGRVNVTLVASLEAQD